MKSKQSPYLTIEGVPYRLRVITSKVSVGALVNHARQVGINTAPSTVSSIRIDTSHKIIPLYYLETARDIVAGTGQQIASSFYGAFYTSGQFVTEYLEPLITYSQTERRSPALVGSGGVSFINSKFSESHFKQNQSGILLNIRTLYSNILDPTPQTITFPNAYEVASTLQYAELLSEK